MQLASNLHSFGHLETSAEPTLDLLLSTLDFTTFFKFGKIVCIQLPVVNKC